MKTSRTMSVLVRVVPTVLLAGLAVYTVVGPDGVKDYLALRRQAEQARQDWIDLERDNDRLVLDVQHLQEDPIHMERLVADELHLARPGATLYVFDEDGTAKALEP